MNKLILNNNNAYDLIGISTQYELYLTFNVNTYQQVIDDITNNLDNAVVQNVKNFLNEDKDDEHYGEVYQSITETAIINNRKVGNIDIEDNILHIRLDKINQNEIRMENLEENVDNLIATIGDVLLMIADVDIPII